MVHEWFTNDSRVVHERFTNGSQTVHEWFTNGSRVIHERFTNGSRMVHERFTSGSRTVHEWFTNGSRVVHERFTSDSRTVHEWFTNGHVVPSRPLRGLFFCSAPAPRPLRLPWGPHTAGHRTQDRPAASCSVGSQARSVGSHGLVGLGIVALQSLTPRSSSSPLRIKREEMLDVCPSQDRLSFRTRAFWRGEYVPVENKRPKRGSRTLRTGGRGPFCSNVARCAIPWKAKWGHK
jgi:hypothetical protein